MRFRKKPVEIEAFRLPPPGEDLIPFLAWSEKVGLNDARAQISFTHRVLTIPTLEGDMLAQPGDWIIKGVNGEFYPCKPDIFEATYEAVE